MSENALIEFIVYTSICTAISVDLCFSPAIKFSGGTSLEYVDKSLKLEQFSSSVLSRQSKFLLHRLNMEMHWPLVHVKSSATLHGLKLTSQFASGQLADLKFQSFLPAKYFVSLMPRMTSLLDAFLSNAPLCKRFVMDCKAE